MKKSLSMFVSLSLITSQAMARGTAATNAPAAGSNNTVYTQQADGSLTVTTTTTTMPGSGETLKTIARKSQNNNMMGMLFGVAAAALTARGAAKTCSSSFGSNPMCPIYVAGFAASLMVITNMMKARKQSGDTLGAVTTFADLKNPNGIPDPDKEAVPPFVANDEDYKVAMATKKKLESQGWKFDTVKGTAKDPNGKTISPGLASSESAMKAAGANPSQIAGFQSEMKQVQKLAEKKAKAIDGGSMFADEGGGGGGASPQAASTAGGMDGGSYGMPTEKLGIDRDPAQVAGMKKDYKGSPIGVAGDSLFEMVDRRYELHQKNGSFLSP